MSIWTNHDFLPLFVGFMMMSGMKGLRLRHVWWLAVFSRLLRIILTHAFVKTSLPELPGIIVGKLHWVSWLSAVVSWILFSFSKHAQTFCLVLPSTNVWDRLLETNFRSKQILLQFRRDRSRSTRGSLGGYGGLSATAEEAKSSWIFWSFIVGLASRKNMLKPPKCCW